MKVSRSRNGSVAHDRIRSRSRSGARSFASTVAAWYDTGAPGRFVPTYKDWQSSGALWLNETTRVTALEQAVWLNLDRSRNLRRGAEIVTVSSKPGLPAGGGTRFYPVTMFAMAANKVYEVFYTVSNYSGTGAVGLAGASPAGVVQVNHTANGSYSCIQIPTATGQLAFYTLNTNTADFSDISVKEIPGAHRIQPTSQSRPILTARKNQFTETEFRNGLADAPVRNGIVAASGLSWPNGITTGVEFPVPQTSTTWAYKSVVPTAASTQYSVAAFVRMSDGNAPVFPSPGTPQAGANDFAMVIGGAAYSPTILADLGAGVFLVGAVGVSPSTPTNASGIARYGTTQSRSMIASGFQIVPGSVAGRYQRVNTATDYDAVGFPVGLRYDGIDDRMYTAAPLDYSGTDKVTVAYAVRKDSDASAALLQEHGPNVQTTVGSFYITAPESPSGTNFAWRAGGDIRPGPMGVAAPAPVSSVIVGVADIAGSLKRLRKDGVEATNAAPMGTGNFTAQVNNEGSRADGTARFVGVVCGELGIGNLRTADELAYLEANFARNLSEALA